MDKLKIGSINATALIDNNDFKINFIFSP